VKKIIALLILIFFIVPARIGAVQSTPVSSRNADTETGDDQSPDNKLGDKRSRGKSAPVRPVPVSPPDASVVTDWSVVFSWKGPSGRHSYRMQISNRPSFSPIIVDTVTASKSFSAIASLAPGSYFWRVKTMNAFRKSSNWSKVRGFRVPDMPPSNTMAGDFINQGAASTESDKVLLSLSAASRAGIAAYRVSEDPASPAANTPGWVALTPPPSFYSSVIPFKLSGDNGPKTISVWFKDSMGRISAPTTGTIVLDTRPPAVTILSRPSGTSDSTAVSFSFLSSKAGSTFACKLDSADYSACFSPQTYEGLAQGKHTFTVKITQTEGKKESDPASYSWVIIEPLRNTTKQGFINKNAYVTAKKMVTLSLSATATMDRKITAYFVSESPDMPDGDDPAWKTIKPVKEFSGKVNFPLSDGNGAKKIHVWFKDTGGNISERQSSEISYFSSKYLLIMFLIVQAGLFI